jgi:hypothetical protein
VRKGNPDERLGGSLRHPSTDSPPPQAVGTHPDWAPPCHGPRR